MPTEVKLGEIASTLWAWARIGLIVILLMVIVNVIVNLIKAVFV